MKKDKQHCTLLEKILFSPMLTKLPLLTSWGMQMATSQFERKGHRGTMSVEN